jgi:hypothetical protein
VRWRIFETFVEGALRHAGCDRANFGAAAVERSHRVLEAFAFFPDDRIERDTQGIVDDLARVGGALAQLAVHPVACDARQVGRKYKA